MVNKYWDGEDQRRVYAQMEAMEQRKRDMRAQAWRDRCSKVSAIASGIWIKLIGLIGIASFVIFDTGRMHP